MTSSRRSSSASVNPVVATRKEIRSHHPHFYDIGTVDDHGVPIAADIVKHRYQQANLLWHTDGSFMQPPHRITALHARVLPPVAPPTEYADMRGAWAALPPDVRDNIDDLMVEHSLCYSREKMGMPASDFSDETLREQKPVRHPLVRTHPRTGTAVALSGVARVANHRLAPCGRARADRHAHRACHAGQVRLFACLARSRPRDVGRQLDHASRHALRRTAPAQPALVRA